jgi:hypothetical protein
MEKRKILSAGGSSSRIEALGSPGKAFRLQAYHVRRWFRQGIFSLIRTLGVEIHRYVEKVVDKIVDNRRKSLNDSNLYHIA